MSKYSPEYITLKKISDINTGSCEKYVALADEIACDAMMKYEFRRDDLLQAMQGAIDCLSQNKTFPADIVAAKTLLSNAIKAA